MSSVDVLATIEASTKRSPAIDGDGLRGAPATNLDYILITPLDPLDPELARRLDLDTPNEVLQTFISGSPDIVEGDLLVVGSTEYPIRSIANWPASLRGNDAYLHLIVEELKT